MARAAGIDPEARAVSAESGSRTHHKMPPLPLLIALMMAFGFGDQFPSAPFDRTDLGAKLIDTAACVFLAASTSLGIGLGLATSIRRSGGRHPAAMQVHSIISAAVALMNLVVYGWILFGLGWISVVRNGMGLGDAYILDELLIILPYLVAEVAAWFGLYPAARELSIGSTSSGLLHHLILRFRMTFGITLPPLLLFTFVGDVIERTVGPKVLEQGWVQIARIAVVGLFFVTLSPFFIRLALRTRRLERGHLRSQLERQARRLGFPISDILVWDTRGVYSNAMVTGILPNFRYVILSDGLIEKLNTLEIAGVFGHEIGHIRHKHFLIFGLFTIGTMGVLALVFRPIELYLEPFLMEKLPEAAAVGTLDVIALTIFAAYFFFAFGALSRMLERQADVFGCRSISCDGPLCPPHGDVDLDEVEGVEAYHICPVGARIFIEGLRRVAMINGIDMYKFSWRHGSIMHRIQFLERLAEFPEAEFRFQKQVRLRELLMFGLFGVCFVAAIATGAIELLSKI